VVSHGRRAPRRHIWTRALLTIGAVGFALATAYCGSDWQREETFVAWARSLPDGAFGSSDAGCCRHLAIFGNASEGIVRQIAHNLRGHGAFLLGRSYGCRSAERGEGQSHTRHAARAIHHISAVSSPAASTAVIHCSPGASDAGAIDHPFD
jgi:hypothetical protein